MKLVQLLSLRHLLVLATLALGATAFAGCATTPSTSGASEESDESDDNVNAEPQVTECCTAGAYICPTDNLDYDYGIPAGSCGPSRTIAASGCKTHCKNVACYDTGATTICL